MLNRLLLKKCETSRYLATPYGFLWGALMGIAGGREGDYFTVTTLCFVWGAAWSF